MAKFELVMMNFSKDGLLEYAQGRGIVNDYVRAYAEAFRILDDISFDGDESERAITFPKDLEGETGFYVELLKDGMRTGHCVYCLEMED